MARSALHVPPGRVEGVAVVPGDKSIAHRWLILAAAGEGASRLAGLPSGLDVRSTVRALGDLFPNLRPQLHGWNYNLEVQPDGQGFTSHTPADGARSSLEIEGTGRCAMVPPVSPLDCGNSGTSLRLLTGLIAACPVAATLTGDESLRRRPMERVAAPLRAMGATVSTTAGRPPVTVLGAALRGVEIQTDPPSAQVKGAVLLAGLRASGRTVVREAAPTRDHTERALRALGAPVEVGEGWVSVRAHRHAGFAATVPGDPSSAAFLLCAAALSGGSVEVAGVGVNPTRTTYLEVLRRMGVYVELEEAVGSLGEPVGRIWARGRGRPVGTEVMSTEVPLLIDEIPALAAVAAVADGTTVFRDVGELRVKESDRVSGLVALLQAVGVRAEARGDDLIVEGARPRGGRAPSTDDHRLAMTGAILGLAADAGVTVPDPACIDVSFPGFADVLRRLGADLRMEDASP